MSDEQDRRGGCNAVRTWLACLGFALASAHAAAAGLNIALTNDDGWDAIGIRVLHEVLTAQGHRVTRVGSTTQQSGSSAALDFGGLTVRKDAARTYSVAGREGGGAEPLTCGLLAIDIATRSEGGLPPDLLVSGINKGANIGAAAQHSGTVGAVIGALNRGLNGVVPGIAISTDEPDCDAPCVAAHYESVATYVAGLIAVLQTHRDSTAAKRPLLPEGIGLNVNYPASNPGQIKGVRVARQGRAFGLFGAPRILSYVCIDCAGLEIGSSATAGGTPSGDDTQADVPDSDVSSFYEGYITIVPIEADYTAADRRFPENLEGMLETQKR
jgi:5'/3'-nucleotidase SurE